MGTTTIGEAFYSVDCSNISRGYEFNVAIVVVISELTIDFSKASDEPIPRGFLCACHFVIWSFWCIINFFPLSCTFLLLYLTSFLSFSDATNDSLRRSGQLSDSVNRNPGATHIQPQEEKKNLPFPPWLPRRDAVKNQYPPAPARNGQRCVSELRRQ